MFRILIFSVRGCHFKKNTCSFFASNINKLKVRLLVSLYVLTTPPIVMKFSI